MCIHVRTHVGSHRCRKDDAIRKTITLLGYILPRKWMCLAEREFLT